MPMAWTVGKTLRTYPSVLFGTKAVEVAYPGELDPILDPRQIRIFILHNRQLKPRPVAS